MKKRLERSVICATICVLFVLVVFAQRSALGTETAGIALVTAAVLPPAPADLVVKEGPIVPPDPNIPNANAGLKEGPIVPPDPNIPSLKAGLKEGPIVPPDPNIPNRGA